MIKDLGCKMKLYRGGELMTAANFVDQFLALAAIHIDPSPRLLALPFFTDVGEWIWVDRPTIRNHITSAKKGVLMVGKREGYRCKTQLKMYPPQAYTVIWNHEAAAS